jgi:hypothetical protein
MHPVLNVSILRRHRALCENESARISVISADLRYVSEVLNNTEGIKASGNNAIVGVRNDTESNSTRRSNLFLK